ncbi:MAG: PPK2 family polyphosphate:nucleotide phosphotransferase [Arcticibacterium sp.]|jgi:PPK2 family polyphosphate:nucleotide phosphotransferase
MSKIVGQDYEFDGKGKFHIDEVPTKVKDYYDSKEKYEVLLSDVQNELDELQNMMYAHNKFGMLVIFQAMDAAGKDGTIKAVFKNVNPQGSRFYSFKRPSEEELDHDFLWRCFKQLPARGTIQVFNRSYYEEVLVVKVHPEILTKYQKIPAEISNKNNVWEKRYEDIKNFENYLNNNGIAVVKFFLNVSKREQGNRLIARIHEQEKNWKFEEGDIRERGFWNDYQKAYEDLINETSTKDNPWHIIPADDKKNMRLIVADVLKEKLKSLAICYPASNEERQKELMSFVKIIKKQNEL